MVRLRIFQELFQRYRRPGDLIFAIIFLLFAAFLLSQLGALRYAGAYAVGIAGAYWAIERLTIFLAPAASLI